MGCSNDNFWKLDKWDKIGIASLIVFFTIFVVLNTFCFADYSPALVSLNDLGGSSDNIYVQTPGYYGYYFFAEDNFSYNITSQSSDIYVCRLSSRIPSPGVSYTFLTELQNGDSFTFEGSGSYVFIYSSAPIDLSKLTVIIPGVESGFNFSILKISDFLKVDTIWSVFKLLIPFISVLVLFVFGFYLISHAIREISKGRDIVEL